MSEPERQDRSNLLEDTLGFNLRSVRTLRDLWVRPRAVFDAILARDRDRYTPMVRLFLALIGLQIALSILWGGYGELMERSLTEADPAARETIEAMLTRPFDEFVALYGNIAAVLHSPLVSGFTALAVFIIARFGEPRPLAVNLNLVFAILTAGSVIGLLLMPLLVVDGYPRWIGPALIATVYALTFIRGAPDTLAATRLGRVLKGVGLSAAMMILVTIGGTVLTITTFLLALFWPT